MSVNGPLFTFSSQTNIQLQKAPSNDVQHLQEELIAVKLREAEANLSLKEMKHKVYDLEGQWEVTQQLQTFQPIGNLILYLVYTRYIKHNFSIVQVYNIY